MTLEGILWTSQAKYDTPYLFSHMNTTHRNKQSSNKTNTQVALSLSRLSPPSHRKCEWFHLSAFTHSKQQDVVFRGNAIYWNKETLLPGGRNELTITCSICRKWPTYLDVKPWTQRPWYSAYETRVKQRFWLSTRLENVVTRIQDCQNLLVELVKTSLLGLVLF